MQDFLFDIHQIAGEAWAQFAVVIAAIGTLLTFISTSRDFVTNPRAQRLAIYREFSADFDDPLMKKVRFALKNDVDGAVKNLTIAEKTAYWAFFEELALVVIADS